MKSKQDSALQGCVPMLFRFRFPRLRAIAIFCVASLMALGIALQPSLAQSQSSSMSVERAAVVLDGRVLFRLGSIDGFTAERRVQSVNADLQRAIYTNPLDTSIPVLVVQRSELTTIRVNKRHLLTVTEGDFRRGITPKEQAEEWAVTLKTALGRSQRERLPSYHEQMLWRIVFALVGVSILSGLIRWGRRRLWRYWTQQAKNPQPQLIIPVLLCLEVGVWLVFFTYVCEIWPLARRVRYQIVQFLGGAFTSGLITAGDTSYSLLDIAKLIALSLVLLIVVRGLTAMFKSRILKITIPDRGMQDAIATLIQFVLMGLGLFILLQAWGIDLSALAIIASVLGVGLGFGLQHIANNFISGWILLIERPVQVGDFINLGDVMGTVEVIGWRSTEIQTLDRVSIIVPNAELVQTRVINWSHGHSVSRLHLPLGVAYDSPIDTVHKAIMEAVQTHPEILQYPRPQLRFLGFGDSSLDFDLLIWIRDPRLQFDIKSDLYYLLEANLRRYNISIPFPQRDLNLRATDINAILHERDQEQGDRPITPKTITPSTSNLLKDISKYSAILQTPKNITTAEITQLIKQMRSDDGLDIKDHRFRLTKYPKSFIGSEAVSWIVQTQKATREAAVRLGQLLVERGIIHHVTDEHAFKDEYLFYRFYEDEG
ncbi:mechanosensitive ion channel domain-containing protein [[Leptolyngbya] sp. PCC 7376]|uniref:mechanosensitive ion channel domain-containing protein n=1 Tax=[Leptolyngbya] sp. PCC 7376 TaxID=111781 RepID=UPI000304DE7E|nr:mechanosensitive ion channel domain-containing protein [[Leptolyngbya] sp. PCC 7376]